jgi:uncharacterized Zn-finger protein
MHHQAEIKARYYEISAKDLPLHCPTSAMTLWNAHPRVFLSIGPSGEAVCPYCGTHYKLKGELPKGH